MELDEVSWKVTDKKISGDKFAGELVDIKLRLNK